MKESLDRRMFLGAAAAAGVAAGVHTSVARADDENGANEKIVVGVMGVNGRGSALARGFARQAGSEVAYVCDVDKRAVAKAVAATKKLQQHAPKGVSDFRTILDDKAVDALVVATPDHWHAPATILACKADKHVYVEKPCSHNPHEGELMVAAARKHRRVVQMGTQRRSWPAIVEGIKKVHDGEIGDVFYSRGWYNNRRSSIGKGKAADVPAWLDYKLWQGPAPEVPFRDNVLHYNWHWLWHWGTGELGNNGVHALDLCRWGLGVDYPTRVAAGGGKYRHDDDQQTPDTHTVSYEFGGKTIQWEGLSWSPRGFEGEMFGSSFHGTEGTLVLLGSGYKIYDMRNKLRVEKTGTAGDAVHLANFLDCVRSGKRPNADILEGHQTTLLCHLGNISYRVGRTLNTDPKDAHIKGDDDAAALWRREYREGWEPVV